MENIITFILGGGRGSRVFPLTKERSKPAIPIGGKYRIVDIPISNCLNSKIKKIFVVTQYNSKSLHQHINRAYRFDHFGQTFVDILPAEQTNDSCSWYEGTAHAVRQNLKYMDQFPECDTVLILSGDQLYNMDFKKMYVYHKNHNADATLATIPIKTKKVHEFGIMKLINSKKKCQITDFVEKPSDPKVLDEFQLPPEIIKLEKTHLASMGIYMFKRKVLQDFLHKCPQSDFGKDIIPQLIKEYFVAPYFFHGYWEDIGTIKAYHQANLDLLGIKPKFKFEPYCPIYTNPRFLPPPLCHNSVINNVIISEGVSILGGKFKNCVIGVRSFIAENANLENTLILGSDWYETDRERKKLIQENKLPLGIEKNAKIKNAIIDKNARIGKNIKILNKKNIQNYSDDEHRYFICDGITVIPKGAEIPDNFVI